MAKILDLDKKQFSSLGTVRLVRGDDWKVSGTVLEKYARYQAPMDLSGILAATGVWPAASGGMMAESFTVIDAKGGQFEMDVPASDTPNVAISEATTIYATLQHPSLGLITVQAEFAVVQVIDRGFENA